MSKRTPFYQKHKQAGAKLIDFGGFEMPVQYRGIKNEHMAVRKHVGLFDVSHMGEFLISGPEALECVQYLITNDAEKLTTGKALYTVMCYPNGGIVDDLLVYKLEKELFMMVVNAANIEKDYEWVTSNNTTNAKIKDISENTCLLALQGPDSVKTLQKVTDIDVDNISFYNFEKGSVAEFDDVIISATGYTGEKGFELYFGTSTTRPHDIWDALLQAGKEFDIEPAGLGARDTLRLEMGFALYGNDIDETTNPVEAKLNWLLKFNKGNFIGKSSLIDIKEKGVEKKLTGFVMKGEKRFPRNGYIICDSEGSKIGKVTSGGISISLDTGIGLGYVDTKHLDNHNTLNIQIRNSLYTAEIQKPPFLKK